MVTVCSWSWCIHGDGASVVMVYAREMVRVVKTVWLVTVRVVCGGACKDCHHLGTIEEAASLSACDGDIVHGEQ